VGWSRSAAAAARTTAVIVEQASGNTSVALMSLILLAGRGPILNYRDIPAPGGEEE
jgi:hypothetical protein